jgi:pilus assembly protein CpaB
MNRTRMIILAVVALALSAGITYLSYRLLAPRLTASSEMTGIVVASKNIPLGTRITEKDVATQQFPKANVPAGAFQDLSEVIGRGAIIQMFAGEPVLESKLAPKEAGAGLTAAIPDGMRALSIHVNDVVGVAGFVQPGSRVDLILTGKPPNYDEKASKVVLENLMVLATGKNVQQDAEGKPQTVPVVTLLVTPEDAAKIALATGDGPIILALRNPLDLKVVDPPLVPREALYGGEVMAAEKLLSKPKAAARSAAGKSGGVPRTARATVPPAVAAPPPPPPPKVTTVELIMGPKRTTATFEESPQTEKKP